MKSLIKSAYKLTAVGGILAVALFAFAGSASAATGGGTATITKDGGAQGSGVTVEKSTSHVFIVILTIPTEGMTLGATSPTFTIPTGFTTPTLHAVATAGEVNADGKWSVVAAAGSGTGGCTVNSSPSSATTVASGQVITVDITADCAVGNTITLTYKGISNAAMGPTAFTVSTAIAGDVSLVTAITSGSPTITVTETASPTVYSQADFAAFDGVNIGTNSYATSSGITATYGTGTGTEGDPVKLTLTGYAPIVTPWFGIQYGWTTSNYVAIGIKLPTDFSGTSVYSADVVRYDSPSNGNYTVGYGSIPLATGGAALGYLDYEFAANSINTKNSDGIVKLKVIWTQGGTPEYFEINVNGLQLGPVFVDTIKNGTFDSGEKSFNTIQAAIGAGTTVSGDTIIVGARTYTEDLTINKSVHLLGPNATINPNTGTPVSAATITGKISVSVGDSSVKGFTITNPSYGGATIKGVYVSSAGSVISNITIENNIFSNITNGQAHGSYGVMVQGVTSGVSILNNKFDGITATVTGGWAHAIEVTPTGSSATVPQNTIITGNVISNVTNPSQSDAYAFSVDSATYNSSPIYANASQITFNHNSLLGGNVRNLDPNHSLNAENNYWGSADPSFGTIIFGSVTYDPWYIDAGMTTLSNVPVVPPTPTPNPGGHRRNPNAATPNLPAQASPVAVGRVLGAFTGPSFDSPQVIAIKAQISDLIRQLIILLQAQIDAQR